MCSNAVAAVQTIGRAVYVRHLTAVIDLTGSLSLDLSLCVCVRARVRATYLLTSPNALSCWWLEQCPCAYAGGQLHDTIISFGDSLRDSVIDGAWAAAAEASVVVSLGSTMSVSPANQLVCG